MGFPLTKSFMSFPIVGSWIIRIEATRPFSIHGDRYFEMQITRLDEPTETPSIVRIPEHAIAGAPCVGQRYSITFLMGQITAVKPEK